MNTTLNEKRAYYLHKGGYESGPFSLAKLQEMLGQKTIFEKDLVWCEGMPEWKPLIDIISQCQTTSLRPKTPKSREYHYPPTHDELISPKVSYKPAILLGIIILIFAFYTASPFLAYDDLMRAMESGDAGALQERIDFPELRQSMKEEIRTNYMKRLTEDGQSNILVKGVALVFGPALINGLVDSIVTPSGMSDLIWNAKFPSPQKDGEPIKTMEPSQKSERKHFDFSYAWFSGPTSFKFVSKNKELVLRFHLRDFKWKLYNIELPRA